MDRRKLFKTGLTLAGSSLLASVAGAQIANQDNDNGRLLNQISRDDISKTSSGRRKLGGTLEVSSIALAYRIWLVPIKQRYLPGAK
jgi:hypothetical protein